MTGPKSMRYALEELLRGLLASVSSDKFTGDPVVLGETLKQLGQKLPIFQQLTIAGSDRALSDTALAALGTLEKQGVLTREASGAYLLSPQGRAHCSTSKRTLFNKGDIAQLEEGATLFDQKCGIKS